MSTASTPSALMAQTSRNAAGGQFDNYRSRFRRLLAVGRSGLLFLTAIWAALFVFAFRDSNGAAQAVGRQYSASLIYLENLAATLADADSKLARARLLPPSDRAPWMEAGIADIRQAQGSLLKFTRGRPIVDNEIDAISRALVDFARLTGVVSTEAVEAPQSAVLSADRILTGRIAPPLRALELASQLSLEQGYGRLRQYQAARLWATIGASLALVAGLAFYQMQIFKKSSRLLNPAMVLATLVVFGSSSYAIYDLDVARAKVGYAKDTALESFDALMQARTAAHEADAAAHIRLLMQHLAAISERADEWANRGPAAPAVAFGPPLFTAASNHSSIPALSMKVLSAERGPASPPRNDEAFSIAVKRVEDALARRKPFVERSATDGSNLQLHGSRVESVATGTALVDDMSPALADWSNYRERAEQALLHQAGDAKSPEDIRRMREAFGVFSKSLDDAIEHDRKAFAIAVVELDNVVSGLAKWGVLGAWFAASALLIYGARVRLREYEP